MLDEGPAVRIMKSNYSIQPLQISAAAEMTAKRRTNVSIWTAAPVDNHLWIHRGRAPPTITFLIKTSVPSSG